MARTALSERAKQRIRGEKREAEYKEAVAAYREHEAANPNTSPTKRIGKIAGDYGVNRNTLKSYVTNPNHRSIWDFNRSKCKVPAALEKDYVKFLQETNDRGLGRDKDQIRNDVNELQASLPEHERKAPVTNAWVDRFLERYRDDLRPYWSSPLSAERAKALNPLNVKLFFELVHEHVVLPGIAPECIWGMDETNSQDVDVVRKKVVGRAGMKRVHRQGGGNKASTTVIAAIGADGTALQPTVIFQGKNIQKSWVKNNVSDASIAYSENGWIDSNIGYRWLVEHFDPLTRERAAGRTRVLFLDNHSSHWSTRFLRAAKERDIDIIGYPPNSTHALQGLDVVAFGRLKMMLAEACTELAKLGLKLSKDNFLEVFGKVWLAAMDTDIVKAAFEKTGIVPYNPDAISATQMKPSTATSTTANSAAPIASPVKVVVDALTWGLSNFTEADLDLDDRLPEPPRPAHVQNAALRSSYSNNNLQPDPTRIHAIDPTLLPDSPTPSTPSITPSRRHHRTSEDSPDSPRKRFRIIASGLARTRASFLISKTPITSSDRLASPVNEPVHSDTTLEPNWSLLRYRDYTVEELQTLPPEQLAQLARESLSALECAKASQANMNESLQQANSRIVLQRLENTAQRQALAAKEQKNKEKELTRRGVLCPNGAPSLLTKPEVIVQLEKIEEAEAAKKAETAQKRRDQAQNKARTTSQTEYWKQVRAQVEEERDEWETKFQELRKRGETINGAKNILGAKPTLPLKATVFAEHDAGKLRKFRRPLVRFVAEDTDEEEGGVGEEWHGFGSEPPEGLGGRDVDEESNQGMDENEEDEDE